MKTTTDTIMLLLLALACLDHAFGEAFEKRYDGYGYILESQSQILEIPVPNRKLEQLGRRGKLARAKLSDFIGLNIQQDKAAITLGKNKDVKQPEDAVDMYSGGCAAIQPFQHIDSSLIEVDEHPSASRSVSGAALHAHLSVPRRSANTGNLEKLPSMWQTYVEKNLTRGALDVTNQISLLADGTPKPVKRFAEEELPFTAGKRLPVVGTDVTNMGNICPPRKHHHPNPNPAHTNHNCKTIHAIDASCLSSCWDALNHTNTNAGGTAQWMTKSKWDADDVTAAVAMLRLADQTNAPPQRVNNVYFLWDQNMTNADPKPQGVNNVYFSWDPNLTRIFLTLALTVTMILATQGVNKTNAEPQGINNVYFLWDQNMSWDRVSASFLGLMADRFHEDTATHKQYMFGIGMIPPEVPRLRLIGQRNVKMRQRNTRCFRKSVQKAHASEHRIQINKQNPGGTLKHKDQSHTLDVF